MSSSSPCSLFFTLHLYVLIRTTFSVISALALRSCSFGNQDKTLHFNFAEPQCSGFNLLISWLPCNEDHQNVDDWWKNSLINFYQNHSSWNFFSCNNELIRAKVQMFLWHLHHNRPQKLFEGYSLKCRHLGRISQGCSIIGGCRRRICASESAADAKLQLPQANTAAQALAPPPSPLVQLNVQLDVPLQLRCSMNLQLYVQLNVQCANLKRQLVNPYGRGSAAHKWIAKIALPESLQGIVY